MFYTLNIISLTSAHTVQYFWVDEYGTHNDVISLADEKFKKLIDDYIVLEMRQHDNYSFYYVACRGINNNEHVSFYYGEKGEIPNNFTPVNKNIIVKGLAELKINCTYNDKIIPVYFDTFEHRLC